ncbi:protein kinase [Streptomyces sp. ISL-87]|nr:protein kinase [Streptomyces sp. ISL-21]MBT2613543.1 protein kinase [Streptomyces sp. ISL-87]
MEAPVGPTGGALGRCGRLYAEALRAIHGAGIVHRDLKPSNVLLAADGPRVIDFGIAHAADTSSLTGNGVIIGIPSYMAPEQAAGRGVTQATDIFALGQVAAYAATGAPVFGEGASQGVLYRIVHEEPDLTAVPEPLTELVNRCLAKDPEARPSITEIIGLCRLANTETVLRRSEEWLPDPVTADMRVRTAAPTLVQSHPTPPSAPSAVNGPPSTHQPTQPRGPAPDAGRVPMSYRGRSMPPGPPMAQSAGRRGFIITLAAVVAFGVAGAGASYAPAPDTA